MPLTNGTKLGVTKSAQSLARAGWVKFTWRKTPRFRRDGKELFYLAANGKLMAVEVKANTSGLEFSAPKPLFETHTTDRYAVTADGQRFLMITPVEESVSAPITVILNWTAEAKR